MGTFKKRLKLTVETWSVMARDNSKKNQAKRANIK